MITLIPNYKAGDQIRCVQIDDLQKLVKGRIYTVYRCERGENLKIILEDGAIQGFFPWRFELVEKSGLAKFVEMQESLK